MATAQLGVVVRHIRSLAHDRNCDEETDGALLRAFLNENDQSAFEALLRRYGPMVLRVAQRTLGHVHDAEDAFQATFMLLARQAASIRKQESLASWLHGVVYRMATQSKRDAARRRGYESQLNPTPPSDPALRAAWQEIQALLDEEIQRLPENIRGAFVLCCLEHKSCAEAAGRLGLAEATVWKHLGRARKLLRERLSRRGVSLTAVLAAVTVGGKDASAALSPSLMVSTAKAAVQLVAGQVPAAGLLSAQVMTFVEGAHRTMFFSKCKMAILLMSSLMLLGAGFGLAGLRRASAEAPKESPTPAKKATAGASAPRDDLVQVRGRVIDPDGKPVAGAKLYLGYASSKKMTYPVRATSGDDGRFEFTFPKSELDTTRTDNPKYQVLAVAKGHGCAWETLELKVAKPLTLRLVKDEPVSGRILDADGKPVAGAKLPVIGVAGKGGFGFLGAVRGDPSHYGFATGRGWVGPLPGSAAVLTTGADGKFRLAGVGLDRVVSLRLEGRGIATAELLAVKGTSFEYQAAVSRPIHGVVRDKDTRKPLAGVTVSFGGGGFIHPLCKAVTDKEGRYRLLGLHKAKRYFLVVKPADGRHFGRKVHLEDTAGLEAMTCDIDTVQGDLTVRGKVIDQETGRPIAGARVDYHPISPNPNINKKVAGDWFPGSEATTGADGSYALAVFQGPGMIRVTGPNRDLYMPGFVSGKELKAFFKAPIQILGDGKVGAWAAGPSTVTVDLPISEFNAVVLLEPGEKEARLVKDVALVRAVELKGRVVGLDGKPLAGVRIYKEFNYFSKTSETGEFTLRRFNPKGEVNLTFKHDGKNLGAFLKKLSAEKAGPLIVKLQPCGSVSGRIVDKNGRPLAGVRFDLHGKGDFTTDRQGRFRFEGLVPGAGYLIWNPRKSIGFASVVAEAGKHKDVGDKNSQDD